MTLTEIIDTYKSKNLVNWYALQYGYLTEAEYKRLQGFDFFLYLKPTGIPAEASVAYREVFGHN